MRSGPHWSSAPPSGSPPGDGDDLGYAMGHGCGRFLFPALLVGGVLVVAGTAASGGTLYI